MATNFQDQLVGSLEKLADDIGASWHSRAVRGEEEYIVVKLARGKTTLDVYVYLDEAGFYKGEEWHMYEQCDFDSPDALKTSILSDLAKALGETRGQMR